MANGEARLFDAAGKNIGTYRLEVMDTFWKRFMGLMGRSDIPIGDAALFRKCSSIHWTRSVSPRYSTYFRYVNSGGDGNYYDTISHKCVCPAFCF